MPIPLCEASPLPTTAAVSYLNSLRSLQGGGDIELPYIERGVCVDSGEFTGMKTSDALAAVADTLEAKGRGGTKVQYKLRDWLFSRQR